MNSQRNTTSGFSMMETVIATAIIGLFFIAAVSSFQFISRAIMTSRTRTVATNLAQERIESLKNPAYSRLQVTTPQDCANFGYDKTFYLPEQGILVGDIPYERRILIQRVQENAAGELEVVPSSDGDTGLKKITATVVWQEAGEPKSFSLSNVREDKNRRQFNGKITGTVQGPDPVTSAMVNLVGAKVAVVNYLNWNAITDINGEYSIKVPTGSYCVNVEKNGYWSHTSTPAFNVTNTPYTYNVTLDPKHFGTIKGYAFVNPNPVISRVVASSGTTSDNSEWVELYNPTTSTWTMDPSTFAMVYYQNGNTETQFDLGFNTPSISSGGYYLIANHPTVTINNMPLTADATYYVGAYGTINATTRGGIAIKFNGQVKDKVGWSTDSGLVNEAKENNQIVSLLPDGKTLVRHTMHIPTNTIQGRSNAFDTDNNRTDFLVGDTANFPPYNSATLIPPFSGRPAYGAIVTCDDDLSSYTTAYMRTDSTAADFRLAFFELPNVATGTLTNSDARLLFMTYNDGSYAACGQIDHIDLSTHGQVVAVPNSATEPAWPAIGATGYNYVLLSSEPVKGYAAGSVINGFNGPIEGIKMEASGGKTRTNSGGYMLPLEPNFNYAVTANPGNENPLFVSTTTENITITAGAITVVDFDLSRGGAVAGRVISNSGENLPDISVVAEYSPGGGEAGSAITQEDGTFIIPNLPAQNYSVHPLLDSKEVSDPVQRTMAVVPGTTKWEDTALEFSTFTITGAFGTISGTVKNNGKPIGTGVLVIASVATIGAVPPIDHAFRNGGTLYYGTVSHSDGKFALPVRGGSTYNVYAWYTTMGPDGAVQTTQKSSPGNAVTAGGTKTVNFTWP